MSDWTANWEASHAPFVKRNADVEKVIERRIIAEKGILYAVKLKKGNFRVSLYDGDGVKVRTSVLKPKTFKKGTEAVRYYRDIRDKLVK